ncbi:MAG: prevent-host-death protein [Chthoniobacterales bacterium]|nr:MAG: prevent-host-death protein [Chthoniobacterales bacterium]
MTITASEFKAKCLRLMDQVKKTGESISITKRGVEVARLNPPESRESLLRSLRGSVQIHGDIVSSLFRDEDFDAVTGRELEHGSPPKPKTRSRNRSKGRRGSH